MSIPSSWVRMQGYPKITVSAGGQSLEDKYYCDYNIRIGLDFPEINSSHPENEFYRFVEGSAERGPEGGKFIITLKYNDAVGADTNWEDEQKDSTCDGQTSEFPLERHPNYLRKWTHGLALKNTATDDGHTWWATAGATYKAPENYLFYRDQNEIPPTYTAIESRTKKADTMTIGTPSVRERTYYTSVKKANRSLALVNTIGTPDDVHGKVGGQWLCTGGSKYYEGKYAVVELTWQWAPEWDSDIYDGSF